MIANLFKAIGLACVVVVVIVLFLPPVTRSREAARRTQCKNNLKQIMLAISEYESAYGRYPPAYTVNSEGKPLHSWRTLILPYLHQEDLYKKIDLSKPWDDPVNEQAFKTTIPVYRCPSVDFSTSKFAVPGGMTTYLAVVTDDSCLRPVESMKKTEISDGLSSTLTVFEVRPDQAVHWMKPADANQEMIAKFGSFKQRPHAGGTQVAMADGSIRLLSVNTREETLRALISADGGEVIGDF